MIEVKDDLFYVLGAFLGDGCAYHWKREDKYLINLVGDQKFAEKYAERLSNCINKKVKPYINRSNKTYFVNVWSLELYKFFKEIKDNPNKIEEMLNIESKKQKSILFVEGFFDAEGCVKVIKEKVRITPKICLDITNVNYNLLEIIRKILKESLGIEARYSIQKPIYKKNKQTAYHLRIYKKEYIKIFFDNINTTKLKQNKKYYLYNWLNRESKVSKSSFLPETSLQGSTNSLYTLPDGSEI